MDTLNVRKTVVLVVLTAAVIGGIFYLNSQKAPRDAIGGNVDVQTTTGREEKAKLYSVAKEITTPDGFINTNGKPVTIGEFVGKKVVLLDIWTYSCINCQRTTPYLNAWYEKYKDKGLVIIGLHTPEFEFEKDYQNVLEATERLGIKYPVVLDNDFSTWNAYQNRFWPRKYLIDIDGYIVYDHAGEGAYEETEKAIQRVLVERAKRLGVEMEPQAVSSPANVMPVDFSQVRSPEVYFGSDRNELLGNGERGTEGLQALEIPEKLFANTLYLGGAWDLQPEYARAAGGEMGVQFIYSAKNVYVVASADQLAGGPVRIKVTRDGKPLGEERGEDVDQAGFLTVREERLYEIIHGSEYGTHLLEITIEGTGVKIYTFTFG